MKLESKQNLNICMRILDNDTMNVKYIKELGMESEIEWNDEWQCNSREDDYNHGQLTMQYPGDGVLADYTEQFKKDIEVCSTVT